MTSLCPAAVGTENFGAVGEESSADERRVTTVADETLAVPVALIKRDKLSSTESCDWLCTPAAFLGEQVAETLGAVGLLFA